MKRPPLNSRHAEAIAVFPPHGDWCATCDGPIWRFEQLPDEESCCWYCRVCEVIESRADGAGVLRHAPASEWVGREDEANAVGTARDGWTDEQCAFVEAVQRNGSRVSIAACEMTELEAVRMTLAHDFGGDPQPGRRAGRLLAMGRTAAARVGHTSREWAETIARIAHHGQRIHVDSEGCHVLAEAVPVGLDEPFMTVGDVPIHLA